MELPHVKPGDVIEPEHHNAFVRLWRAALAWLEELKTPLSGIEGELYKLYSQALSQLKSVVGSLPLVKDGDDIRRDHYNLKVRALVELLRILDLLVVHALGAPDDLMERLQAAKRAVEALSPKWAGDPILAEDHNALVDATQTALGLLEEVVNRVRLAER